MLDRIGCPWVEVRKAAQLQDVVGLIIPGGESTTLLKLLAACNLEPAIRDFHAAGRPIFGTCAGVILLATEVTNPAQHSLGLLDVTVERNSYGRQVDSFESFGPYMAGGDAAQRPIEMVFIRAPRITRVGPGVHILARHGSEPVLVATPTLLGATFHPEMTSDTTVHESFVHMCRSNATCNSLT
jgi:5'-phosphate synthase pdxT subunit